MIWAVNAVLSVDLPSDFNGSGLYLVPFLQVIIATSHF